jgi:hypothetical protein
VEVEDPIDQHREAVWRSPGNRRQVHAGDNLGYAIFEVPPGSYRVMGIGGEPQNVVVSPGQTIGCISAV